MQVLAIIKYQGQAPNITSFVSFDDFFFKVFFTDFEAENIIYLHISYHIESHVRTLR